MFCYIRKQYDTPVREHLLVAANRNDKRRFNFLGVQTFHRVKSDDKWMKCTDLSVITSSRRRHVSFFSCVSDRSFFIPSDDVDDGEDIAENPKQNRVQNVLYLNDEDEEDEGDDAEQEQDGRKVMVGSPVISTSFPSGGGL